VKKKMTGIILVMFILTMVFTVPVAAETENNQIELTLEETVARALRYSNSLYSAQLSTEIAREDKADMAGMWSPSFITDYNEAADQAGLYQALPALEYAIKAAEKSEDMQKDLVAAEACKAYYDLQQAVEGAALAEKTCLAAEKEFEIKELQYQVGMLSFVEYQTALMNLASARADYAAAYNTLNNNYISFNQLVGLKVTDRPVLVDKAVFTPLELNDLDAAVTLIVRNSPAQWIAEKGAQLKERLSHTPGSTDKTDLEVEKAELDASALYDSTIKGVYSIYYSTKSLEDSYQTLKEAEALARKGYEIARLQYEIGMATQADVLKAEAKMAEAQLGLNKLTCQHNLMKIGFEKPWCLSVLLTGGSKMQ
jgi:outer membrane protein